MQPISLLMSHFNVENSARLAPGALAAAQDTAQGQEIVRDSLRVTQTVQANEAAAEMQKVHQRTEDEEREDRRRDARDTYERDEDGKEKKEPPVVPHARPVVTKASKEFELYV